MMLNIILRNISLLAYIALLYYFFSNGTNQRIRTKCTSKFIWLTMILSVMIISLFTDAFVDTATIPFINLILSFTLIFSMARIHNVAYLDTLIWSILLIAATLICEWLSLNITKLITTNEIASYSNPKFAILGTSISTLLGIAVFVLLKSSLFKGRIPSLSLNISTALLLISIPILSIVILVGVLIRGENISNQNISETAITSSVILLNICVIFLYKITVDHQHQLYKITLSKNALIAERRLLDEVKKNRTNVLKLKHDLKNQYLVILGLINNNKTHEAKNYIKNSLQILEPPLSMYATDGVLNYLLSDKLNRAKEKNIEVCHQIFISKHLKIDNDILAIVLGNIIDNALEASNRLEKKRRQINVTIKQFQNDLIIEVSNNFNSEELITRQSRKTAALGMKNIDGLIADVGGIYRHWHENDRYYVSIVLFNVYHKKKT
ncbi:sensor histidine kinase [Brochothrix thermosphacta]|nr:GHKL domain-containing protein [Brochothrix thermosphacta]